MALLSLGLHMAALFLSVLIGMALGLTRSVIQTALGACLFMLTLVVGAVFAQAPFLFSLGLVVVNIGAFNVGYAISLFAGLLPTRTLAPHS